MHKVVFNIFFLFFFLLAVSCSDKSLFTQIKSSESGIVFNNTILENDSINILDFENIYNGGGVGIGDFNNDGLNDIYFTGNLVPNKLYLNKDKFKFDDITTVAGVEGKNRWSRGVAVVDINADGLQDIYVCATAKRNPVERQNLLYVNQGVNKDNIPVFKELASEYGLNDTTHSTMAAFFDYDNDGDLDVYILVNHIVDGDYPNRFRPRMLNAEHPSTDRLYRNDWDSLLKHPVYTEVSKEAGILIEGYGHGVAITDINKDGWKDVYISNDYLSNNILYINNRDGTFTDQVTKYFKHTSANAMGNDVNDINNDGLLDLVEVDMNPEDNYRKKMMVNANSYQTYQNSDYFKFQYQYVRNTLQLNMGPRVNGNDSIGEPIFSDIAFYAGVAETDWSWTPLVTDFDNDGFRDIIITNGFPKDITDHDFVAFRNEAFAVASKKQLLEQIPAVKLSNYGFKNNGDLTFSNVSSDWGLATPSFSNGAAYADFDNDGDVDLVVNNINDEALLYRNNQNENKKISNHYITVKLKGDIMNPAGFGTWIELYYTGKKQVYEQSPYRGYLSSISSSAHFGLGKTEKIDSLIVKWPNGKKQVLLNVAVDQLVELDIKAAKDNYNWSTPVDVKNMLLTDITASVSDKYEHQEKDFIDFNIQKLLPHKFSEYGPALASSDLNGDGFEDIIIGGSFSYSPTILFQQATGTFKQKQLLTSAGNTTKRWEDMGILLFDADQDNDIDIYIASGGFENNPKTESYQDHLYINDGKGNFTINNTGIPRNYTSKSCVRAADYDKDGDLDLFLAGRVEPWNYPKPVSSFIYRNDSKSGMVKFTDVTSSQAPSLNQAGLVCDAVFTDFDNDGYQDLVLAGEWMSVKFLKNDRGVFKDVTNNSGISNMKGYWNSILPADFDNDGDMDYVVGNMGLNSFYRGSEKYPVRIYAKDFNADGNFDAVPSLYLPTSQQDLTKKEYPAHVRDDMVKQMVGFRSKFQTYNQYGTATLSQMFTKEEMKDVLKLEANYLSHSLMINKGNGKFELKPLPALTQFSCLNGMVAEDIDGDGNVDLLANGNDYGTEVSIGRYDACNGMALKGDGKGGFSSLSITQSGWFIPGNGKSVIKIRRNDGKCIVASGQNRGPLKIYQLRKNISTISLNPNDVTAIIRYKNGTIQRREINYGSSFLSQSGRFLNIEPNIAAVEVIDYKGNKRQLNLNRAPG